MLAALVVMVGVLVPGLSSLTAAPAQALPLCPCTIWSSTAAPAVASWNDPSAVELGVRFRSETAGYVTAVRFYKGSGNTGTHVGSLWAADGTRLASATFSAETGSGWQTADFATPVAVAAGTTYIASYYAPNGGYAATGGTFSGAGVDNPPLHALADGVDGGNGVYRYGTGGGFPSSSYNATNYWVDAVYTQTVADSTAPVITTRSPAAQAASVPVTTVVAATFSEAVSGATVTVTGPAGAAAGTTSYDSSTTTATFRPTASLSPSTTYSVAVSGARDTARNLMTSDTWSFTTAASTTGCPCSLFPASAVPATASANDNGAVELGVKVSSDINGYITGVRFYKGAANTGTHVGHLWSAAGQLLGSGTFTSETATGWQQVLLSAPVAVTAGTTYVASYYAPVGGYAVDSGYFSKALVSAPLRSPASATDSNGLYRYGASAFPNSSFSSSNYWVDVVFATTAADTTPPTVTAQAPFNGTTSAGTSSAVSATFSEAVSPSSLVMTLTTAAGAVVPGTVTYDSSTTTARLVPTSPLTTGATYSVSVSAADVAGNAMAAPSAWSFRTTAPAPAAPVLDGPVLVVAPPAPSFGRYLGEVLRAEGVNEYALSDLSALNATTLARYDTLVLGETPLTSSQVFTLTNWVYGGGNLIAMRPDKQLASLLGIASSSTTLAEGYVKVDTTKAPGTGITDQTVQFHGTADRYTLSGATAVATLYSDATTPTTSPAVTSREVGFSGGSAAAFTYDLARSVVYTRQGNPAWAGQDRDSSAPVRSDDMFWGSTAQNGYVNLDKVAVPQADEQQRLLVNVLQNVSRDKKPLPRFWYFPRMLKAVVIGTGDDHGHGGTASRFDQYAANSPAGCSLVLWTCLRTTSYIFPNTPITNAQAAAYDAQGFEVGLHPQNGCTNFTPSSLDNDYTTQLAQWQSTFPSLPSPVTNRYHCIVYSDWASQPKTEAAHGMGLDTNYYYFPGSWMANKPGFMTGSGMPMHFADTDGTVIPTYQAATQMTDESGQAYPATANALLDGATGPLGYYGAFTANMHTDLPTTSDSDGLLSSAISRGVPIVSARQMLTWLQGRDASSFTGVTRSGNTLTFTVNAATGADGLSTLLPVAGTSGTLLSLSRAGQAVPYTVQTVKGVQYAAFASGSGTYTATYGTAAAMTATASALRSSAAVTAVTSAAPATAPSTVSGYSATLDGAGVYQRLAARVTAVPGSGRAVAARPVPGVAAAGSPAGTGSAAVAGAKPTTARGAAPKVSGVRVLSLPDGTATVTWRTDVPADSSVELSSDGVTSSWQTDPALATAHRMVLTGLRPGATQAVRVRSTDAAGRRSGASAGTRFVQSTAGVVDATAQTFAMGTSGGTVQVTASGDGELQLSGDQQVDFDRPVLPAGWTTDAEGGGQTVVYGGSLRVDGTRAGGPSLGQAQGLSASVVFDGSAQRAGLESSTGAGALFAGHDGHLYARTTDGRTSTDRPLPDTLLGSAHTFAVSRAATAVTFLVDGATVAQASLPAVAVRPVFADAVADGSPLVVDWSRSTTSRAAGTYLSRVLDAQQMVTWDRASWSAQVPAGASLVVSVRTGDRATPDGSWTSFQPLSGSGAVVAQTGRYLQYRIELRAGANGQSPVLDAIGITHGGSLPAREHEVG